MSRSGNPAPSLALGIDVGGTFTDVTAADTDGRWMATLKVPSTPRDPSAAILLAVGRCLRQTGCSPEDVAVVAHGTTIATNALLERRGSRAGLLVTKGFRDLLLVGRQDRPSLYDPFRRREPPLVPRELTFEVNERMRYDGTPLTELTLREAERVARRVSRARLESLAVCFLHSYVNSKHEELMLDALSRLCPDTTVTLSSALLPQIKEYERAVTAVANAYVGPVVGSYLRRLRQGLEGLGITAPLLVMQSNGGLNWASAMVDCSVQAVLSGPAAGVVAGLACARASTKPHVLTVDMGGTSFDISLVSDRAISLSSETEIAGLPISVPSVYLHTLGAGGGSIAWVDEAGALRVGPHSAGAVPGPACYGNGGTLATVTDANLVLGRLGQRLLDGDFKLDIAAARAALREHVQQPLGLSEADAALGVIRVVNAEMAKGMRLMSIAQGYHPRDLVVVAFGGAGPLHAVELAESLGIAEVVVPAEPGATSARGLLLSDLRQDFIRSILRELDDEQSELLDSIYRELGQLAVGSMGNGGLHPDQVREARSARLCYAGQAFQLDVPAAQADGSCTAGLRDRFEQQHLRRYGYLRTDPVWIESVRLSATGRVIARLQGRPNRPESAAGDVRQALTGRRQVTFADGAFDTGVYSRAELPGGALVPGPSIIEQLDSTCLIPPGYAAQADPDGNLIIRRAGAQR